jgi:large subunit ribosomal protein L3
MPIGILGKKLGMSQMFDERGVVIPVTLIAAGPCPILQTKSDGSDGYNAVQLGFDPKPEKRANKAEKGRAAAAGVAPMRFVREFRVDDLNGYAVGEHLDVGIFEPGEKVDVIGRSIGRGMAGTIKRYNTSRGPESHGSMFHRRPGSSGASAYPSHTFKGKGMPGRMGAVRVTAINLVIVMADREKNIIAVRGSVPGHTNGYVMIRKKHVNAVKQQG